MSRKKAPRRNSNIVTSHWRGKKFNWDYWKARRGQNKFFSHMDQFGFYAVSEYP